MTWAIREKEYSQRQVCLLIGMDPKIWRYASRRPDDAAAHGRLSELAQEQRRFGYRRLHILLGREGPQEAVPGSDGGGRLHAKTRPATFPFVSYVFPALHSGYKKPAF